MIVLRGFEIKNSFVRTCLQISHISNIPYHRVGLDWINLYLGQSASAHQLVSAAMPQASLYIARNKARRYLEQLSSRGPMSAVGNVKISEIRDMHGEIYNNVPAQLHRSSIALGATGQRLH